MPQPEITCLHLADIHFGMETYGYTNPETGLNTRLEDFRDALARAIDYAIENTVDLVLFAGDAYKRNNPNPTEQREFVNQFCRLADAGIPTAMISGNHDIPVMQGKASSIDIFRTIRPGFFHVFINQPTMQPPVIETRNGPIAICALPFISPSFLRNVPAFRHINADNFKEEFESFYQTVIEGMPKAVPEDIPRILLAHLAVHGAAFGGYKGSAILTDEVQILPANLANAGYDYIAVGHIHRHQNLSPKENIPIVYPGSIDRVDFGEASETKGFVLAKVRRGGATYTFVENPIRPMINVVVESPPETDLTDAIVYAIECEPIENAIVRVTFTADDDEMIDLDMKRIHNALQPAHFKAGFRRIPRNATSTRRATTLTTEVSLSDALNAYINEHEDLKPDASLLLEKAKEIELAVSKKHA
jgi:DNA repair protein SbcD/Mre11